MASNNNQHAAPAAGDWTELWQQAQRENVAAQMGIASCSAVAAVAALHQ